MSDNAKKAHDAAAALLEALWAEVEALTHEKGKNALTAFGVLARPYLRSALTRMDRGDAEPLDRRTSQYVVSAMFWEIDNGEEEAELLASTDETGDTMTVHGMAAALEQLGLWIAELHEGEELSEEAHVPNIVHRTPTLKTAIIRGAGRGEFRVHYTADGYKCLAHATVRRAELEEEPDDDA